MASVDPANGLTTTSIHALDDSSTASVERLRTEHPADVGRLPDGAALGDVDPETAARRFLDQALAGDAVPELTAPSADGATSDFTVVTTDTVPLTGTRVVKFRQTVNDVPVYGSQVTVELDDRNDLIGIDSSLGEPRGVDPVASVSPADALTAAAAEPHGYVPALAGVVPRLTYYFDRATSGWHLAYFLTDVPVTVDGGAGGARDRSVAQAPPLVVDFVVDAHDGSVIAVLPRTPTMAAEQQTAVDSFGDDRTFLASTEAGALVLFDPENNVRTFDFGFDDPSVNRARLPGQDVTNPPAWPPAAVSAHANAVAVSEFLRTVVKRNNIDDRGGVMTSSINCVLAAQSTGPTLWHNAQWNGRQMVYGQARQQNGELRSLAANVDVVAHEMFHGVTDHTSRLEYRFQSGALNESYSDIFGVIVSNHDRDDPRNWDWEIGERLLPGGNPLRDMSDPPRFRQPDHMRDLEVMPESSDFGGVHTNSGIPNKAAFLLLTAVDGDGNLIVRAAEATAVFYLALTRLAPTSQFTDSRRAAVAGAQTLFRALPQPERTRKIAAVRDAFDAVGITEASP